MNGKTYNMKKLAILIPALDPPLSFSQYISELFQKGFTEIVVVDDGSSGKEQFERLKEAGCHVLTHPKNEGKGQALKTGLLYYKEHYDPEMYAGVITADSDGQHLSGDVGRIAALLQEGEERLILGSRDFSLSQVPPKSRFGNSMTSWIFRYILRLPVGDTQTGLRGIPNVLIEDCLRIPGKRFEYETSMLLEVGKKAGILEIPIETVYLDENKGTHFNPFLDSLRIYRTIFGTFFRYLLSSLSASVLDLLLFWLFSKVVLTDVSHRILAATVLARICSSVYNFLVNRNIVFKSKNGYSSSSVKYFSLCAALALASALLVTAIHNLIRLDEVLVKMIVDTCLFFISYQIQHRYIFGWRNGENDKRKK